MIITGLSSQVKDKNRVNVMVDGKYRFSLDINQVIDLKLRIGTDYTDEELTELETESQYGKVYGRALEYCLMRLHSGKEVRDYLYRKTRDTRTKTGDVKKGVPVEITTRVYDRLLAKGYINDEKFARNWIENRNLTKGASSRKLQSELRAKGVESSIIDRLLKESSRSDSDELAKVIAKKRARYPDERKFMMYLAGQGFGYDEIKNALSSKDEDF
jgi:regulatory protein